MSDEVGGNEFLQAEVHYIRLERTATFGDVVAMYVHFMDGRQIEVTPIGDPHGGATLEITVHKPQGFGT